ncbi:hypothetical protein [Comamonas sp. JC664]|uniref:hypothetical protein n=1 Tax=Comamonas sp. JC664 TaxID=2801917 RepID=UPI0036722A48
MVLLEPLSINLPELQIGEEHTGELTLTNYGLIQAEDVVFKPPQSDEYYRYEFSGGHPQGAGSQAARSHPLPGDCRQAAPQTHWLYQYQSGRLYRCATRVGQHLQQQGIELLVLQRVGHGRMLV